MLLGVEQLFHCMWICVPNPTTYTVIPTSPREGSCFSTGHWGSHLLGCHIFWPHWCFWNPIFVAICSHFSLKAAFFHLFFSMNSLNDFFWCKPIDNSLRELISQGYCITSPKLILYVCVSGIKSQLQVLLWCNSMVFEFEFYFWNFLENPCF